MTNASASKTLDRHARASPEARGQSDGSWGVNLAFRFVMGLVYDLADTVLSDGPRNDKGTPPSEQHLRETGLMCALHADDSKRRQLPGNDARPKGMKMPFTDIHQRGAVAPTRQARKR